MKGNILAMNNGRILGTLSIAAALVISVTSCSDQRTRSSGWEFSRNMYDPIGYNPDQPNPNFSDGMTAQLPPSGTVPIGFVKFEYDDSLEDYQRAGEELVNPLTINAN